MRLTPVGAFALLLSTQPSGARALVRRCSGPTENLCKRNRSSSFHRRGNWGAERSCDSLGSRSMGGGARLGLGMASAPPTDQVQSSLPWFTLLHPLTRTLPGSHHLILKTHFPSWSLSSWEVMLPGNLVLNCLAKAAVEGLSSVKSHQKSHLGDANQMVERTVSHVHRAGGGTA